MYKNPCQKQYWTKKISPTKAVILSNIYLKSYCVLSTHFYKRLMIAFIAYPIKQIAEYIGFMCSISL